MLKNFLIPTHENGYTPIFSTKVALIIFTLWIFVFNGATSVLLNNYEVYADNLSAESVIELTNRGREKRGLNSLESNALLTSAAYAKANNMFSEQYWDHFGPNDETPWQFIEAAGFEYSYAGENLGKGFSTSEGLYQAWMASPTHRENILAPNYTDIGVAIVNGTLHNQNLTLVVQMFGRPEDDSLVLGEPEVRRGEDLQGDLKSIRIVYPQESEIYNDPQLPIKGETSNVKNDAQVDIIRDNKAIGDTKVREDGLWEYYQEYDWREGENQIDAVIEDDSKYLRDTVSFYIDSIPPDLEHLSISEKENKYILDIELDTSHSDISLVSGEKIINKEVSQKKSRIEIDKDDISDSIFLVLSDGVGNVNQIEISKYFQDEDGQKTILTSLNATTVQRGIILAFAMFILVILVVQVYYYRKLGMLQEKEGEFLTVGVWWLILLFGSFIGYSGTIT